MSETFTTLNRLMYTDNETGDHMTEQTNTAVKSLQEELKKVQEELNEFWEQAHDMHIPAKDRSCFISFAAENVYELKECEERVVYPSDVKVGLVVQPAQNWRAYISPEDMSLVRDVEYGYRQKIVEIVNKTRERNRLADALKSLGADPEEIFSVFYNHLTGK